MKRILFISIFILIIFISGCTSEENNSSTIIDTSECDRLTEDMAKIVQCYGTIAISNQEPSVCDKIKDKEG